MLAVRKKQYQEQLLAQTEAHLATVEELCMSVEFKLVQARVFEELEKGTQVLKQLNAEVSMERIERLREDNDEAMAYQEELTGMLQGVQGESDLQAIQDELDQLMRAEEDGEKKEREDREEQLTEKKEDHMLEESGEQTVQQQQKSRKESTVMLA